MSRGPGRLQRAVLAELEAADGRSLSRRELEDALVVRDGHGSSNLLRAVRGLQRMRLVSLCEGRSLDDSFVSLLPPAKPVSDDDVFALLAEVGEANAGAKR